MRLIPFRAALMPGLLAAMLCFAVSSCGPGQAADLHAASVQKSDQASAVGDAAKSQKPSSCKASAGAAGKSAKGGAAGNGASGSGKAEGILVAEVLLLLVEVEEEPK